MISNVRLLGEEGGAIRIAANFVIYRFRRDRETRMYVGSYQYRLRTAGNALKIAERIVRLDATELAALGSVSFIL